MEIPDNSLAYLYLIVVWTANINDLIRGHWFFNSTFQILFWNSVGILAIVSIILRYHNTLKKNCKEVSKNDKQKSTRN